VVTTTERKATMAARGKRQRWQQLSPSNIVDRLDVIPWRHGTHDKVWDMTMITSLRKVEVEEEVEEKVEVEVEEEVWRRRRRRTRRGGR
jgi:hypothetical protein